MKRCTVVVRALLASVAIASAVALGGCETDGVTIPERAMKALSPDMVAEIDRKHMPKELPIVVRIFKEEAELEVWKQDESGALPCSRPNESTIGSPELGAFLASLPEVLGRSPYMWQWGATAGRILWIDCMGGVWLGLRGLAL